ncbi:MAG: hypothetical protein ACI959_001307 [Limisphaerales bacterium]
MNLRNKSSFEFLNILLYGAFLCLVLILFPVNSVHAQTSISKNPNAILNGRIKTKEIKLGEEEIISNLLIVSNPSDKERIFRVEFTRPAGWRRIGSPDRYYTVAPRDSVFVPARLIPSKNSVGSKVIIHALIITDEGQQVAQDYFYAKSEKNVSWLIDAEPGRKVYFKNNEIEKYFAASLTNLGAFDQDVFVSMEAIGNGLTISDTAGNELNKGMTISLEGAGDTTNI